MIAGIVLAADAATPSVDATQAPDVDGLPLLEHATLAMAASGLDRFVVVVGDRADEVLEQVDLHGGDPVRCERWAEGQAASLACGLAAIDGAEAAVVTLGDQPGLAPESLYRVLSRRGRAPAVRATYGDAPGHPVVIEHSLFGDLRDATGGAGVRGILWRAGVHEVPCDDLDSAVHPDAPADLVALRTERAAPPVP